MIDPNNLTEEDERELSHALVQASKESWAKGYSKAPKQHAKLITTQAKTAKILRKYLRDLAERAPGYIDWAGYAAVKADKLQVKLLIRDDAFFAAEDTNFMTEMYDPIALATTLGANAAEVIYTIPSGLSGVSEAIQSAARGQIATLIGKKLDKDGNITNNPNAKYNINETTRGQIEESIRTSLSLGETTEDARSRLQDILYDPDRADIIANTETVNAFQVGQMTYAKETGAIGKEWQSSNDEDICAENEQAGVIGIGDTFPSGDTEPVAHPNCLCNTRYVYQAEADAENYDL